MSEGFYYYYRCRLLKLLFQVQLAPADEKSLFSELRSSRFSLGWINVLFVLVFLAQLKLDICSFENFLLVIEWIFANIHAFRLIQLLGLVEQVVQSQGRLQLFEMEL